MSGMLDRIYHIEICPSAHSISSNFFVLFWSNIVSDEYSNFLDQIIDGLSGLVVEFIFREKSQVSNLPK